MSELIKSYIVRNAEQLSPQQVSSTGLHTHPTRLQSARYSQWIKLGNERKYKELDAEMREFAEGGEALRSFGQFPQILAKPLEFAAYKGYKFGMEEFMKHMDAEKMAHEFGEMDEKCHYRHENVFQKTFENIADQLLVETKISNLSAKTDFDKQVVLKTLNLIERASIRRRDIFEMNPEQIYSMPVIIDGYLIALDPCRDLIRHDVVNPMNATQQGNARNEPPVVAPNKCDCKCNTECVPQNPCCAKITHYIADLYVVRDELNCYEVGEMSYIENVLQSEIRERVHKTLEREEILNELTNEIAVSEEKDFQVDEKFSIHKEIDKTIEQELSLDAGVTGNQNWGSGSVTTTANVGYNQSKKDAQKIVQDYAKQIISKSVSKLEKKVKEFSSIKLIRESKETNRHVFGGTTGAPNDISRQFFYVNSVRKAQTFKYGKRLLLDFYVPEPSELYKRLVDKQFKLEKPKKPTINIEEITDRNYLTFVMTYGLKDFELPPKMTAQVQIAIIKQYDHGVPSSIDSFTFTVPENYQAVSMHSDNPNFDSETNPWEIFIHAGNNNLSHTSGANVTNTSLPFLVGTQVLSTKSYNLRTVQVLVTIECELLPEIKLKWQLSIYDKIMETYQKELDAYNADLAEFEKNKQSKYQQNPFILLQDMQEQLKQAAISYISCQFFDSMNAMNANVEPCGFPQPDLVEAEKEGEFVRFFEQAFEWKFMNFIFYPYFWSRKCTWQEKINEQADNMLFQRFLKSGYARVSISVRLGFEAHVLYFLKTKKIWVAPGEPPVVGADFVPIYQEIKEDKDNFNTDREGKLDVLNGSAAVALNNTEFYWNEGDPLANPPISPDKNDSKIALDIDREIFINGKPYRIVDIQVKTAPNSWTITLDRPYEGADANNLPWSTGALFSGAPWEFKIPTRLVWLREKGGCLPCYPIECED